MARLMSRNARWGLFVFALLLLWTGLNGWLCFSLSRRFDRRLSDAVSALKSELSASNDATGAPVAHEAEEPEIPRYIVLGHGRASGWGYLDIQYVCDGAVDRIYYNMDTLRDIPQTIETRAFRHEMGLIPNSAGFVKMSSTRDESQEMKKGLDFDPAFW